MNCEIHDEPEHLGVADEPNPEDQGNNDHRGQNHGVRFDPEDVTEHRPDGQRDENGGAVSNGDMRKKISTLTGKKVAACGTTFGRVEKTLEYFCTLTYRAPEC